MKRFVSLPIYCAVMVISLSACAQSKKISKTPKAPVLVQATLQKTLPGRPEMEPTTEYRFVIVWKDNTEPAGFFWRGDGTWQSCDIGKVRKFRKLVVMNDGLPNPLNYETINNVRAYKKGDTLELYPINEGKYPTPAEVPAHITNTIYYKTTGSKWLPLPVKKITKLPEIAMP